MPVLLYIRAWRLSASPGFEKTVFFQGVNRGPNGLRLQIRVPDSTWRQELHFQRLSLLKAYCTACRSLGLPDALLPVECWIVV